LAPVRALAMAAATPEVPPPQMMTSNFVSKLPTLSMHLQ
jgi:hypothetical protein